VLAFANLNGIRLDNRLASVLGKHCAAQTRLHGGVIGAVADDHYGTVGNYPLPVNPMEVSMATMTLTQRQPDASASTPLPIEEHAGGTSHTAMVLALDLGHRLGWAVRSVDGIITSGTAEFRQDRWQGGGIKFLRFKTWLTEIKNCAGGIDLVVYEAVRSHAGVDASHAFGGWLAILTAWCEHHGIPYQGVSVGTIKRHVAGKGNADKAAVIAAVKALGYNPADDNEADALALLHWAMAQGLGGAE
jgi:hypothetical protein